jgi:hypothetical protein
MSASPSREQELMIMEAAAVADGDSPDFGILLEKLGLLPGHKDLLIQKLRSPKARWRAAESPGEALRKSVLRDSGKLDLAGKGACEENHGVGCESFGYLDYRDETADSIEVTDNLTGRRMWRQGGAREAECEASFAPRAVDRYVADDLRFTVDHPTEERREFCLDTFKVVDWCEVARRAGFDDDEAWALNLMTTGTLYSALQKIEDPEGKKALRAAWARVERKLQTKIRDILKK